MTDTDTIARVEHRLSTEPAEPAPLTGSMLRCRRVALGLLAPDLGLPASAAKRLPWVEDGTEEPRCGWAPIRHALQLALERHVSDHMWAGGDWMDLRLPWPLAEIEAAAATVMAEAELAQENA